jgi:HEPN domain-containing protein
MKPPEQVKLVLATQWLAKADQDIKAAAALLGAESPLLYPACFHAQQAAEKYLKALLTWQQIEFPKTHDIDQLLDLLQPSSSETAAALRQAAALTPYGVELRYPGEQSDPDIDEAERAVALAEVVRVAVLSIIPVD